MAQKKRFTREELIARIIRLEAALRCLGAGWYIDNYMKGNDTTTIVVQRQGIH